ncbi:Uncharacterised protein [Nocardia africana]|uniref:Uncharacterized protein n=1 Tax=Nocardia africana TaxID=134964 RepID=A0A378WNQ4_9NOCA|nr:Uncharacterised protein [Nocardia africana]
MPVGVEYRPDLGFSLEWYRSISARDGYLKRRSPSSMSTNTQRLLWLGSAMSW